MTRRTTVTSNSRSPCAEVQLKRTQSNTAPDAPPPLQARARAYYSSLYTEAPTKTPVKAKPQKVSKKGAAAAHNAPEPARPIRSVGGGGEADVFRQLRLHQGPGGEDKAGGTQAACH